MTVSTTAASQTFGGNNVTTAFTYQFIGAAAQYIEVIYTDTSGNQTTLTQGSQYTVTLNPAAAGQLWGVGGTITYPLSGSPIPTGSYLTVTRVVQLLQLVSISNQGAFYPEAVEQALDELEFQIQQFSGVFGRALTGNLADPPGLIYEAQPVSLRANQFLFWDSQGNLGQGIPSGVGVPISTAMQPVVEAVTIAVAQGLLGIVTSAAATVATIAALRAKTTTTLPSTQAYVLGYTKSHDGGEGMFVYVSTDVSSSDNGGTIIVDASGRRWYREWEGPYIQLLWFGGSGATDFAPVLTSALAFALTFAATQPGASILLPAQTMNFSSLVTFNYPGASQVFSLSIVGVGLDASVMNWVSTDGMTFNLSSQFHTIHLRDLTISAQSTNTQVGLRVNQTFNLGSLFQSDFTRIGFRGSSTANCWATGSIITGLSNYNFVGSTWNGTIISGNFIGVGCVCQGKASPEVISVVQNFQGCDFVYLNEAVTYGDYLQGMTLSQCNITDVQVGIHQHQGSGVTVIGAQLSLCGCQINCNGAGVFIEGTIGDINISGGNLFYGSATNANCVFLTATSAVVRATIVGNSFEGNASSGSAAIAVNGTDNYLVISGNTMFDFITGIALSAGSHTVSSVLTSNSIQGAGTGNGIALSGSNGSAMISGNAFTALSTGVVLGSGSANCNVQANAYTTVTTQTTNTGTGNSVGAATK